jgi:tetratricopeptide (TPR) repeat protein
MGVSLVNAMVFVGGLTLAFLALAAGVTWLFWRFSWIQGQFMRGRPEDLLTIHRRKLEREKARKRVDGKRLLGAWSGWVEWLVRCGRSSRAVADFKAIGKQGLFDLACLSPAWRARFTPVFLDFLRQNELWTDYFYYVQDAVAFGKREKRLPPWRWALALAKAHSARGETEQALLLLHQTILEHPHPTLYLERALIQAERLQFQESAEDLRKARKDGDWTVALLASFHLLSHEVALGKLASAKSWYDDFQGLRRRGDAHGIYQAWDQGARELLARLTRPLENSDAMQKPMTTQPKGRAP